MDGLNILATGRKIPARCVTNDELSRMVDTSDEWITTRTGIRQRYLSGEGETNAAQAAAAAALALERAGLTAKDVGLCVVATFTPDHSTPSLACEVHGLLGLPESAPAFDVNAACTGFLTALEIARVSWRQGGWTPPMPWSSARSLSAGWWIFMTAPPVCSSATAPERRWCGCRKIIPMPAG